MTAVLCFDGAEQEKRCVREIQEWGRDRGWLSEVKGVSYTPFMLFSGR